MPDCAHAAYARSSLFAIVKSSPVAVSYVHSQTQSQPRRGSRRKCKRPAGVDDLPFRSLRLQHTCGALVTAAAASEPRSPSRRNSSSSTSPPHHRQRAPILLTVLAVSVSGYCSHPTRSFPPAHATAPAPLRNALQLHFCSAGQPLDGVTRPTTTDVRDALEQQAVSPARGPHLDTAPRAGQDSSVSRHLHNRLPLGRFLSAAALPQHTQWRRPHPGYAFSQVSNPPYTHTQHPVDIAASAADTLPCSPLLHNLQRPPPTLAVSEIHFSSAAKYSPS